MVYEIGEFLAYVDYLAFSLFLRYSDAAKQKN